MNNRNSNILCWNIRGINDSRRWDAVRNKIEESSCSIICLQETKKESFDSAFIRKFAPRRFDNFVFAPSVCASRGILVLWNSSHLSGQVMEIQPFAVF